MGDLFDRFSSPFSVSAGSESESPAAAPTPAPEPEPAVEPTVSEPAPTEARREESTPRKPRSAAKSRSAASSSLSKATVQRVFSIEHRLDDASAEAKRITADLLRVKQADDAVSMIVALDDAEAVASAKQVVSEAAGLAGLDDLKFAVSVAGKSHADRKALWDLASGVADSVPSGKFPQADLSREVTMLREVLSAGVADRLAGVLDLLV